MQTTTYRCPKCGKTQVVYVPVISVTCGACPKRRPRQSYPLMQKEAQVA